MNPFRVGLEKIRNGGWTQFAYKKGDRYCFLGAVCELEFNVEDQDWVPVEDSFSKTVEEFVLPIINEQFDMSIEIPRINECLCFMCENKNYHNIPRWNDAEVRTQEDVEMVMEKAAVKWEEQNGG